MATHCWVDLHTTDAMETNIDQVLKANIGRVMLLCEAGSQGGGDRLSHGEAGRANLGTSGGTM